MMFQIEITFDDETREFESEKPELVVGRSTPVEEVDVDLNPDSMVSRKHFILTLVFSTALKIRGNGFKTRLEPNFPMWFQTNLSICRISKKEKKK